MTMANSELRSPFVDRMFNLLPQGHEEAMKHAFYNVAAICFIAAGGGAAMAVYFILQPFVKPLLWAILVGSILHPIKQKSVILTKNWLKGLDDSNTPLIFGCLSVPFKLVDISSEWIGTSVMSNLKLIIFILIGMPILYYLHNILELDNIFDVFQIASNFFSFLMSLETLPLPITLSLSLGSLGLVVTLAGHLPPVTLQIISHLMWTFIFFLFVFSLSGSLKVIFILLTLVLVLAAIAIHFGWISDDSEQSDVDEDRVALDVDTPLKDPLHFTPRVETIFKTPSRFPRILRETLLSASFTATLVRPDGTNPISTGSTNGYIHAALWACLAVQLWRHMWLFHLFPIPLSFFLIKSLGTYVGLWGFLKSRWNIATTSVSQWTQDYKDQIFPRPLQWIYQAIGYFDRIIVGWLTRQVDVVTTAVVMLVVVVGAVLASLLVVIQIYGESVHLVHFGTRVINQTLSNPEAQRWLPQGIDQMVGSVVGNAYAYGQTGIANYVKSTFQEKDPVLAAQLEKTIMEALDRIQGAWLAQDATGTRQPQSTKGTKTPEELRIAEGNNISQTVKPPLLRRMSQDLLNLTVLMNFGRENVGMIMSIVQSVWTVAKGNFSLVLQSATAMISILMVGGNAILNFLVNGVVFLTALYYLLVASDSQYKPVRLFSLLSPGAGNSLGTAMEEAVSTVCLASLKLTAFYGLYTWLIHTIFQVNFVIIPAAIAALLGAVPFLGTYWAALPAALDLWLAQKRGCEAILLMVFQFLPTMLVDTAVYAEIKGGGHPYLTGLAVAGGIFWLGFEGAIIGPLLLCILLVAVSMYSSFMHDSHAVIEANTRLLHRRLLRTGTVA